MEDVVYEQVYATEDEHWWFQGRREIIHALLAHAAIPSPAEVLDVGCGTGRNIVEFASLGTLTGIEPAASAVDYCRARGLDNVIQGEVEAMPFGDYSFDALFAFDVLEHLRDDVAGMREMRRVARRHAVLVATVPAYRWLWSQHDDTHHHHRRYTRPQLVANAAAAGWRPRFVTYFNTALLPPIAAVRAFRRGETEQSDYEVTPVLNRVLHLPMRAEAAAIRRGVRLPAGVSVGMVCSAD